MENRQKKLSELNQYLERDNISNDAKEQVIPYYLDLTEESSGKEEEQDLLIKVTKKIHMDEELWEALCEQLEGRKIIGYSGLQNTLNYCEKAGYGRDVAMFFDWKEMERDLAHKANLAEGTYPEYREYFVQMTDHILGFYELLYGEGFRDRGKLPGACLMAMVIEEGLKCEDDKEKFVEIIKQGAGLYPSMGPAVKKLLTLYLREPQRREYEAKRELKKLRKELLGQARQLSAKGQYQEALMILQQLKTIVPNDLETAALSLETRIAMVEHVAQAQL